MLLSFWIKIKNYLLGFFGFLAAVFAGLFFIEKKKNEVLNTEVQNAKVIDQVNNINTQITDLEKETKDKENEPVSQGDLLNFLNNKPNTNK